MLKELEEQFINLLVSIEEGKATQRQLKGFVQALDIVLDDDEIAEIKKSAEKRSKKIINQL